MTPVSTVVRVIDEEATLEHVARHRSYRPGLHFEHYDYGQFDRTSRRLQVYGFVIAVAIVAAASLLARIAQ